MKSNNQIKDQILSKLTKFGLNPSEWRLTGISETQNVFFLKNKTDKDFQLIGFFENQSKKPVLKSLELISL